jgi:hypothetical protein
LIALLAVECFLTAAGLGEEEIFKLDPNYGFVHMTNKRVTWRPEGFSRSYFGPDGTREEGLTIRKPANVFRIAILGDSIVESLQVPIEETFGKQLERQFKKTTSGKELQVLNFGISGYSTDLSIRLRISVIESKTSMPTPAPAPMPSSPCSQRVMWMYGTVSIILYSKFC